MSFTGVSLALLAASQLLGAQESEVPLGLNLPTADHLLDWDIGLRFTHRFQEPARGASKDWYGWDGGNYAGVGLDFGIKALPGLNAQLYRTADNKTAVMALQEQLVNQEHFRISARLERFDEAILRAQIPDGTVGISGLALQLPSELRMGDTFTFLVVPTYLSRTTSQNKGLFNVGLGLRWQFAEQHYFLAEYYPRPTRLDAARYETGAAVGYRFRTKRHRFTIMGTNTTGTTTHQVMGGDYGGGPRALGRWSFGFNLVRVL